ncbi:CPBP family intramembrane metalloprotease [Flavobacterium agricola]|uniref:CPBP family intramembrane metalloprotease n=1 Tax=Flavobacterium agricola TaxID=2870839 RepID=A0ABY6M2H1_9FLAO|nr:CPBP family intramembrane glutamic endopeptidase [Flavobacterium agricola]UYW01935.1 CPBP family intramembrane metalloprotease [Flavobacterium agricola]
MYIEQLKKQKVNQVAYLLAIISLVLFFGMSVISSFTSDSDINAQIQQLIEQVGKTGTFVFLVLPLSLLCAFLLLWVKFVNRQSITSLTTARKKVDWGRIFFMFGLWGVFLVVSTLITYWIYPEDIILQFNWSAFIPFAIVALVLIPFQIAFEEYFFRGYMMQYIGYKTNSRFIPLFITSVFFGLVHLSNPEIGELGYWFVLFYIATGFVLGIMTLMDDGLELALGFHAANNLVGALLITSDFSVFQTDAIFKDVSTSQSFLTLLLQLAVIYPILLFICAKKYKWSHWKQNLFGKLAS